MAAESSPRVKHIFDEDPYTASLLQTRPDRSKPHDAFRPQLLPVLKNEVHVVKRFVLDSGVVLKDAEVAYRVFGAKLSPEASNALVVCHALTGHADVAGWWADLLGPGKCLDTDKYFIVCCNIMASPYGTVSPLSTNPDTGKPYGKEYPRVSVRDTVRLHKEVLDILGVKSVHAVVGASLGGMQALEWSFFGKDYVRSIVPIATCGRHTAYAVSLGEVQRRIVMLDPVGGLATARMAAMLSYRSYSSFERRFARHPQPPPMATRVNEQMNHEEKLYAMEGYLRYQGRIFVNRFDADCYLHLTWMLDTHDVSRGRGSYEEVLAKIEQPALIISVTSDGLYPPYLQEELAKHLPRAVLKHVESDEGHDAFLMDNPYMNRIITEFLNNVGNTVVQQASL